MIQSLLYHLPGRQGAEPGVRGHIIRGLQVKLRSLTFILREIGSCGSKSPQVLGELRKWRPVGIKDIASLAAKPPVILLAPYVLAEGKTEGQQETETEAGRTARKLSVGFQ